MAHELFLGFDRLAAYGPLADIWHASETSQDGRTVGHDGTLQGCLSASSVGSAKGIKVPLYHADGTPSRFFAVVNHDNHTIEYQSVSEDYCVPDYASALTRFGEALEKAIGTPMQWDTALTVKQGARAMLSGCIPGSSGAIVHKDGRSDEMRAYAVGQLAMDGAIARTCYLTDTRIVCNNTLTYAQKDANRDNKRFGVKNTSETAETRWDLACDDFGKYVADLVARREGLKVLAQTPMSGDEASDYFAAVLTNMVAANDRRDVVDTLLGANVGYKQRASIMDELLAANELPAAKRPETEAARHGIATRTANLFARRHERLMSLYCTGKGNAGNDAFDALNAVTEWVDHDGVRDYRGSVQVATEKRSLGALCGEGANVKAFALETILERVAA